MLIAPSFGDIFRSNCLKIGLVPIALPAEEVAELMESARGGGELTVDLELQEIARPDGVRSRFDFDPFQRESILNGLDEIARSLAHEDAVAAYEAVHPRRFDTVAL